MSFLKKYINWSNSSITVLIIGACFRLAGYASSAIRYDEAISLYRATIPFSQYLIDLNSYSSLFLWELILRLISKISTALWLIRFPAVVWGIGSLMLVWRLMGKLNFSQFQKLFASLIISFCPGLLWISQNARAYGLLVLLYLLSILLIIDRKWLGLTFVNCLMIYTHIIGPAFAIGSLLFAIVSYPKEWRRILLLGGIVIISWIPWYLIYINIQPTEGFLNAFWLGKLTLESYTEQFSKAFFVRNINPYTQLLFTFTSLFTLITLMIKSAKRPDNAVLLFMTPFASLLFVSIFFENALFYRTQITLLVPLIISFTSKIDINQHNYHGRILSGLWIVVAFLGLLGWTPRLRGGDVDIAAQFIRNNWKDGDVIYYGTGTTAMPFDYYLGDKPEYMIDGLTNSNITPPTLMEKFSFAPLENINHKRAWVIFPVDTFLPPEQRKRLDDYVKDGKLIQTIQVFEVPDIKVFLVPTKQ